jgi:hypothetical protein
MCMHLSDYASFVIPYASMIYRTYEAMSVVFARKRRDLARFNKQRFEMNNYRMTDK